MSKGIWYSSHGEQMTIARFMELEVIDRENYTREEVENYFSVNNIMFSEDLKCIWVTQDPFIARSYNDNPKDNVYAVDVSEGTIIFNFDDGDGGFLYVDAAPAVKAKINIKKL